MAKTDANPPMMPYTDEYSLVEVDADYLTRAVKPKQFIHIDQTECIACEGCVDICPWKCIHFLSPDIVTETFGVENPADKEGLTGAEGATAPVNSQASGPRGHRLWREAAGPAEGITISGERTEGASGGPVAP